MQLLIQMAHALSLGLWFGSMTFFSFFTALPIINRMRGLATEKPDWLPGLQDAEQGTRLAGEALAPIFARYFLLQVIAGSIAFLTAMTWFNAGGFVHRLRVGLVALALILAFGNLLVLAPRVSELRTQRYSQDAKVAQAARARFGPWHNCSLITDMVTLLLVAIALTLAAMLPAVVGEDASAKKPEIRNRADSRLGH